MGLVAKAFQDIITFSRNSNGTYVNSNGYITNSAVSNYLGYSNQPENALWTKSNSFVQQNLLTYSQDVGNAVWQVFGTASKVGGTVVAPDGTLTAYKINVGTTGGLIDAASAIFQNSTATAAATTYTFSAWVLAETSTVLFRLSGTTSTGNSAGSSDLTATTTWQRVTFTFTTTTAPATANVAFRAATAGGVVGNIYVWGAQLVQGSVPGDYRATTSAALPCLYADYNGALRARKLCEDSVLTTHEAKQDVALSAAQYTFAASLKAGERTFAMLYHGNSNSAQVIDLTTGAASGNAGLGAPTSYTITNAGNGWWRVSITVTGVAGTNNFRIYPLSNSTTYNYTGNGSSGIYIADAQLNDGSAATAYWDNATGSATYAPRFDYDPATLAAKGLLVEESRTNYMTRSSDFSNSAWNNATPNIPTVTADAILSPDGTTNADLLTAATGGVACQARQPGATGTTGNFTASVFLKVGSATRNRIILTDHTTVFTVVGDFQVAWTAGVASVFSTASGTASIVSAGNGWYRCIVTASTASANAIMGIAIFPDPVAGTGSVYAWQAQVEPGAFATSAIPTVASQVTRAADVASVNTLSPWFNSVAGTIYAEATRINSAAPAGAAIEIGDGTSSNRYLISVGSPSPDGSYIVTTGGVTQASISVASGFPTNTIGKVAAAYAANDFQQATNATLGTADTSGTLPSVTTAFIGRNSSGSQWNGWLRRITYYPRRLTNAELQTLTTL